jgi:hypothetical protein
MSYIFLIKTHSEADKEARKLQKRLPQAHARNIREAIQAERLRRCYQRLDHMSAETYDVSVNNKQQCQCCAKSFAFVKQLQQQHQLGQSIQLFEQ